MLSMPSLLPLVREHAHIRTRTFIHARTFICTHDLTTFTAVTGKYACAPTHVHLSTHILTRALDACVNTHARTCTLARVQNRARRPRAQRLLPRSRVRNQRNPPMLPKMRPLPTHPLGRQSWKRSRRQVRECHARLLFSSSSYYFLAFMSPVRAFVFQACGYEIIVFARVCAHEPGFCGP
jgi:hypothetical protein